MKVRPEQLGDQLRHGLQPVYLISGDEPLQVGETTDAVRAAARRQGYDAREVMHVERNFDWSALGAAADSLSLFAEQRIIELRMPEGKPGDAGGKALTAYAANPPADTLLLISSGKLEKRQQQSKWFRALDTIGVTVQIWPIDAKAMPGWVSRRMHQRGLSSSEEAARLLAERVEGNLLAAAQEIEKLLLLYGEGDLSLEQVESAVSDSARFDIFELVDTALLGDAARTSRIIDGLRNEGVEAILVLWALAREIRALCLMAAEVACGQGIDSVMRTQRVWSSRQQPVRMGLQRHNLQRWQVMLRRAARLDRVVKGAEPGNAWDELLQLALMIAGVRLV